MDCPVVRTRMVLALVVSEVFLPGKIFDVKFSLSDCICDPEELHLHSSRSLPFDGINRNADGGGVDAIHRYWRLGVTHFF